ncbi:MAG: GDSL-type esterase/lipase family protein [Planctomycetia bacterium]|nr:GDSL-type esterase/lipase family protein [Planctomycetia bacterium]
MFSRVCLVVGLLVSTVYSADLPIRSGDKIAFLGASITQSGYDNPKGYVHLVVQGLKEAGVEVVPVPAGISGNESEQMLARIQRDVIDKQPQWMTFKVGGNDVWHKSHTLEEFQKNVLAVVDKVSAAGIQILLITQTPLGENADDPRNIRLAPYNDFLRKLAKERGFLLADANAEMQNALSDRKPEEPNRLTTDGVHLNDWGNRLMARSVLRAFGVPEFPGKSTLMKNATAYEFTLEGRTAKIVVPHKPAAGKPWLFRTVYWRAFPNSEDAMIEKGWAVAFIQTDDRFGTPQDNAQRNALYDLMVKEHGFSPQPVLFGMSYGGLSALRWAIENPEKISGIYVDAPVCNFIDWKDRRADCWDVVRRDYGMTEETLLNGDGNPIFGCRILAEKKIPMLLICGAADKTVLYEQHGKLLAENFQKAGGDLVEIVKPDCDHHPHGLDDPAPVVNFYEKCRARTGQEP